MYFDEEKNNKKIREYLKSLEEGFDDIRLRDEILLDAKPIVKAIIYRHSFAKFEPFEDVEQEGQIAVFKSLKKFNPEFVTKKGETVKLFNYFSNVVKKALIIYTLKRKDHRQNSDLENYKTKGSYELQDWHIDETSKLLIDICYPHKKYRRILKVLLKVIKLNPEFFDKKFFRQECKISGISDFKRHSFLKFLKKNKKVVDF